MDVVRQLFFFWRVDKKRDRTRYVWYGDTKVRIIWSLKLSHVEKASSMDALHGSAHLIAPSAGLLIANATILYLVGNMPNVWAISASRIQRMMFSFYLPEYNLISNLTGWGFAPSSSTDTNCVGIANDTWY